MRPFYQRDPGRACVGTISLPLEGIVRTEGKTGSSVLEIEPVKRMSADKTMNAVKVVIRAPGRKVCAKILWLPVARYMRLKLRHMQSGRIRLA